MNKLKSRKLVMTIILICLIGGLNAYGTVTSSDFVEFVKWALGIYTAGNAASKFGRGE